ncbi:Uma2 family endonuclease [Scytonema millei]|uniref:Uma2 family endonuclease n=1 Tax=Scytonema millei VB511283 TaxID=1245923 RepID=A0A9X5E1N5_9CYAN|nr:Uma2 family endonuclease [Scytonema millei]NHC33653.1 Uma2 family endonuclease [Scytonema millei VB511283]
MNETALTLPSPLKLHMELTDEQFFQLCQHNRDLQFERTAKGEILIMPPTGGETGNRNFEVTVQLGIWNKQSNLGKGFDSSTGFKLPNGANRSPDAAWVRLERWEALTTEQREKFVPLCPDFVVELLSPSDSLKETQAKMQEYIDNGTRLGWLIIRKTQRVEIYRPNRDVEVVENPTTLSGEDILLGFVLDLRTIIS